MSETRGEVFSFSASDGVALHCYRWWPAGDVAAVIHVAHGMGEHAARYAEVAERLVDVGFGVIAQDHRGHGGTADEDTLGDFGADGWNRVVTDMHELIEDQRSRSPDAPRVLFGHSMGASLSQQYLWQYGERLTAVVLSGSPGFGGWLRSLMLSWIARYEAWRHGRSTPSERLADLLFGSANEPFEGDSGSEWLSRDPAQVLLYVDDPLCGFVLRPGSLCDYVAGARATRQRARVEQIDKGLPVYVFAGGDDPVHDGGRNIARMVRAYRRAGLDVTERMYPGGRHEMLNETNRDEVVEDLIAWLRGALQAGR